jgi:hypothetical protein
MNQNIIKGNKHLENKKYRVFFIAATFYSSYFIANLNKKIYTDFEGISDGT